MARKSTSDLELQPLEQAVQKAAKLIRSARRGVVLTGAGISTPSGIPDFRSRDSGLWAQYDPMEVASLRAFRYAPENFFAWLRPLATKMLAAEPNPAHLALARLEKAGHIRAIVTQNIDGLHQRAGSETVLEVHGTMDSLTCVGCYRLVSSHQVVDRFIRDGDIPRCPDCGQVLKPNVILFEEQLPLQTWQQAEKAIQECDLLIVAGSSLEVTPVAGLPMLALRRGISLIIVNYMETYLNRMAEVVISQDVAEVLPWITEEVLGG